MTNLKFLPKLSEIAYKKLLKNILFRINPEKVHEFMVGFGEQLSKQESIKSFFSSQFVVNNPALNQNLTGINFKNPIGLAAGFDYEARLTQILHTVGFGFETVGTITSLPYGGNSKPMLGRLPKSKSLMVNKGFKNLGTKTTIQKLKDLSFEIPIGISIGKTNISKINTQKKAIKDILCAFELFEKSNVRNSFYELNISCPNLYGNVNFYSPKNLSELLTEVDNLKIKKPIFVKMPLDKSEKEILKILETISKFTPKGVIISNLATNRKNNLLDPNEVSRFPTGNFSGKPTHERSNHLIKLAYKRYKSRLLIAGCGGVFSAEDAYEKIKSGASLIQLITGMIFEGPQIISQINSGLIKLLKRDRLSHISEAIGADVK